MSDDPVGPQPVLRGSLVTIRPGGPDDVPLLRAVLSEESVTRWWGEPEDAEGIAAGLASDGSSVLLVVEVFLGAAYQGRGVGPEAIGLLPRFLCERRGHHRITIDPAAANERAIRCYAKVGFRPVGVMRQYERGADGQFHDGLLMELLRDDLPA